MTEDEALTSIFAGHGAGTAWVAEKLGSESAEATFDRAESLLQTASLLEQVLDELHAAHAREDSPSGEVWVSGTLGSGFLNLNPTLFAALVRPSAAGGAVISVRTVAKEGLIKQRSAQKAVGRLRVALRSRETSVVPHRCA